MFSLKKKKARYVCGHFPLGCYFGKMCYITWDSFISIWSQNDKLSSYRKRNKGRERCTQIVEENINCSFYHPRWCLGNDNISLYAQGKDWKTESQREDFFLFSYCIKTDTTQNWSSVPLIYKQLPIPNSCSAGERLPKRLPRISVCKGGYLPKCPWLLTAGESLAAFQGKLLTGDFKKKLKRGKTKEWIKVGAKYRFSCDDLNGYRIKNRTWKLPWFLKRTSVKFQILRRESENRIHRNRKIQNLALMRPPLYLSVTQALSTLR